MVVRGVQRKGGRIDRSQLMPVLATVAVVAVGMVFFILWDPVVPHTASWADTR